MTPWQRLRAALLDPDQLIRAVASGRRRGQATPEVAGRTVRRVELRVVELKTGPHLQVESFDDTQAHTANHAVGADAETAIDALLAEPFANWHVETTTHTVQVRLTKKGEPLLSTKARNGEIEVDRSHDRNKNRLLPSEHPVLAALGISDAQGRIKPSRQAKLRQVEEFLRLLAASLGEAIDKALVRTPSVQDPLRVVDLGCGNAYLTLAAHAYLTGDPDAGGLGAGGLGAGGLGAGGLGLPVRMIGIDVKQQAADHNRALAAGLGIDADFVVGSIGDASLDAEPDVVLALHACDTATDDALARAVKWQAPLVLAAPCCHHDIAAQLRRNPAPTPYAMLTRDGILRERFADTLTDALRAALLRSEGYRVDVMEFVDSAHTPRNTMIRAVRVPGRERSSDPDVDDLVTAWGVQPRLGQLLGRA